VLTVLRVRCLKYRRMNIRSRTFLARLHAVFDEEAMREGGIQLSVGGSDHLCSATETRKG
jgi:hypothetical protein